MRLPACTPAATGCVLVGVRASDLLDRIAAVTPSLRTNASHQSALKVLLNPHYDLMNRGLVPQTMSNACFD